MKNLRTAVLLGLGLYLATFYATPLPGDVRRWDLLRHLALLADDFLAANWFGSPAQFTFADRLPVLLAASLILGWAAALGWLLLVVFRASVTQLTRLETFVFATAAGLASLGTWVLLLGLFGFLDRTGTFLIPAALTLIAVLWTWHRRSRRGLTAPAAAAMEPAPNNLLSHRWLWLAVPFVVAVALAAMLPPFEFDVCEYHLQAPKEFFEQGRITFLPHNVYANMPLGVEMLSLLGMVVTGDWWLGALVGKMVIAAFTPLCALGLFAAGQRFHSTTAGVAAALLYVSTPWVASTSILPADINVSSSGLIEGALACYLFLALDALLLWHESAARCGGRPRGMLLLAGYLAGAAVATKYPALLLVLLPLTVWLLVTKSRQPTAAGEPGEWRRRAGRAAIFLVAAAVACGPWFAKNWALTGNPTYPLLHGTFDGRTWNAEKDARWNRVHRPHDFSAATLAKDVGRVALTGPLLSPLLIPLAVLALLRPGAVSRRLVWQLFAYIAFAIAVWWLLTHRIDRFWLPTLPLLALLAGIGVCWTTERWWRVTVRGLLLATLAANFLLAAAGPGNAWFVPLTALRADPHWVPDPWHRYFNRHATDGCVLTVGDAAVFDLRPPVIYSTCFDDCPFEQLVHDKSAAEIRQAFAARRIAYVYVNWAEIARYRSPGNYGFTPFVQPSVFDRLVRLGILAPLPPLEGQHGQAYRVLGD
ncbi:MAG: hypothetical protein ABFC63_09415 [Thermoguttaceae bacterium]